MSTAPTIDELISGLEVEEQMLDRRELKARSEAKLILDEAQRQGRKYLNADEDKRCEVLLTEVSNVGDDRAALKVKLARAHKVKAEEAESDRLANDIRPGAPRPHSYDETVRIGHEPSQYRAPVNNGQSERGSNAEPSFLEDLYKTQVLHDPAAAERIARHGREVEMNRKEFRSFGTGAVPGFAPPQYLVDMFAQYARAGRTTANLCTRMPLPEEGMTTNLPRVTTPSATAIQASEGGSIGNQDMASTLLTSNVNTIAGYLQISRQAMERSQLLESVVQADLAADYNMRLDLQVLVGTGASGQHLGILSGANNVGFTGSNSVLYTDASPTVPELLPKVVLAMQTTWQNRFAGPTAIVTSPKAWAWIMAQVDTTGRPLVSLEGVAMNPAATLESAQYGTTPQGKLYGLPVYVDANLADNYGTGTNESRLIMANWSDAYLFEDSAAPVQLMFEAPAANTLQVLLVAYGYSAFAVGRQPKGFTVMTGTGLIVPAL